MVLSDHRDSVETGGGEHGGEGTWLLDSSATQESIANLHTRSQHLQGTGYSHL